MYFFYFATFSIKKNNLKFKTVYKRDVIQYFFYFATFLIKKK
jgi:hypothetical protein